MSTVVVDGERVAVTFGPSFPLDDYPLFLRAKKLPESDLAYDWQADTYTLTTPARFAPALGIVDGPLEAAREPLADHLFDYQAAIVASALEAKRYAIWADTGLGKTAMFLEWARHVAQRTGGRVLILSPLQIIEQTRAEAERFYGDALPIERLATRAALVEWATSGTGIAITNPDKLIDGQVPELHYLSGLVVDESSLLKTGGGTIKWNLIHSAKGIEYKLSCTATPAPNDTMEYASQASFLEKLRSEGDILWTFFTRDKRGDWRVKPHARAAFYRFMASWSIYLRDPAHYGWDDILSTLPPPEIVEERLPLSEDQKARMLALHVDRGAGMFGTERMGIRERAKLSQLAKGFVYGPDKTVERVESAKPARVAEIVGDQVAAGRPTLVWTVFDEESAIVADAIAARLAIIGGGSGQPVVRSLHGDMAMDERLVVIDAFRRGEVDVLISKAQLVGYGLNFQACRAMVFSGFDDSFERMYQAIRRAYRYGQTETVHVFVPYIPELEGLIFDNLLRKQVAFDADTALCERNYRRALAGRLG